MIEPYELLRQHKDYGGTKTYREIGQQYGMHPEMVRGKIRRYREKNGIQSTQSTVTITSANPANYTVTYPPQSTVLKIEDSRSSDDRDAWEYGLAHLPRIVRYAHVSDLHVPDHDEKAVRLAASIIHDFKPHVMLHGSDAFNFETIARFETSIEKLVEDALQDIKTDYAWVVGQLNEAAPNSLKPFLIGNHEVRVLNFMMQKAPQFRHTVIKTFSDMIRENDGLWLGFNTEELDIGPLKIYHGRAVGAFPAKAHAERYVAYQRDVIAGHVHRASLFSKTGPDKMIESVTSGCLCNLKPSYSNYVQDWQQGIVLVTIDFDNWQSHFEIVNFKKNQAVWGGKVYRL